MKTIVIGKMDGWLVEMSNDDDTIIVLLLPERTGPKMKFSIEDCRIIWKIG
jgi:hypothetical protein